MEGVESVAEHKGDLLEHGLIQEAETQEINGEAEGAVEESNEQGDESVQEGGGEGDESKGDGLEEAEEEGEENVENSKKALVKAIFGDSDEEDNNEEGDAPTQDAAAEEDEDYVEASARKLKRLVKRHRNQASDDDEDAPQEEEAPEDGEEERTPKKKKRLSKKQRNAIANAEEGEEGEEGEERKRKKKASKKKKKQQETEEGVEGGEVVPDDGNDYDTPVKRKKKNSDFEGEFEEFDAAMARLKPKRAKKDLTEDEENKLNENAVQFIAQMESAAELDEEANQKKQPATNKIAKLKQVSELLHKKTFAKAFVNQGGFVAIRKWLQPLPDKSLPSLNIREQLLEILFLLPFDKEKLHMSDVGKVVMFLYKEPTETVKNKRQCNKIIEKWSRPIFGLHTAYKGGDHERAEDDEELDRPSRRGSRVDEEETEIDKRTREQMKDNRKFHARIPNRIFMDFKKQPTSADLKSTVANAAKNPHVAAAEADRILKKKRKAKPGASTPGRVMRAERISIEGRLVK